MTRRVSISLMAILCASISVGAQPPGPSPRSATPGISAPTSAAMPLPKAPIRLAIPDVRALATALGGGFKKALHGTLAEDDGVARGFAQSQVGAKLQDQWYRFRGDNPVSFQTLLDLQATSAALAVLDIGHLEMALVLDTPLGTLPELFEAGEARIDQGRTYHVVRTGAADERAQGETRMGLVWTRDSGRLVITTSERAMKLTLEAMASGERFAPKLDGLACLELDMDSLADDLYFKRDFLFGFEAPSPTGSGKVHAALRLEAGRLVEVREGRALPGERSGATFDATDALASGWLPGVSDLLAEIRRALLEPIPQPSLLPRLAIASLPASTAATADDRYVTNIEIPALRSGGAPTEAAEIAAWSELLTAQPIDGFGYVVTKSRARLLALPWPKEKDGELLALVEATLTRRGARFSPAIATGGARQFVMGPQLPVLALKRSGEFMWMAQSAADLRVVPVAVRGGEVTRFSRVNLAAIRAEGARWGRIEGPRSSDHARPFSDRILGLLGWMPSVRTFEVERRVVGDGFRERVVFGFAPPPAPPASK